MPHLETCGLISDFPAFPARFTLSDFLSCMHLFCCLACFLTTNKINYSYADDTQLYISMSPDGFEPFQTLNKCIENANQYLDVL